MSSALNFGKYRTIKVQRRMVTVCTMYYTHYVHVDVDGSVHCVHVRWSLDSSAGQNYATKPFRRTLNKANSNTDQDTENLWLELIQYQIVKPHS